MLEMITIQAVRHYQAVNIFHPELRLLKTLLPYQHQHYTGLLATHLKIILIARLIFCRNDKNQGQGESTSQLTDLSILQEKILLN